MFHLGAKRVISNYSLCSPLFTYSALSLCKISKKFLKQIPRKKQTSFLGPNGAKMTHFRSKGKFSKNQAPPLLSKHMLNFKKILSVGPKQSCLYTYILYIHTFFPNPPLLARRFQQYRPNEIPDKHKNKLMWQRKLFLHF